MISVAASHRAKKEQSREQQLFWDPAFVKRKRKRAERRETIRGVQHLEASLLGASDRYTHRQASPCASSLNQGPSDSPWGALPRKYATAQRTHCLCEAARTSHENDFSPQASNAPQKRVGFSNKFLLGMNLIREHCACIVVFKRSAHPRFNRRGVNWPSWRSRRLTKFCVYYDNVNSLSLKLS